MNRYGPQLLMILGGLVMLAGKIDLPSIQWPIPLPSPDIVKPVKVDWTDIKQVAASSAKAVKEQTPEGFDFKAECASVAKAFHDAAERAKAKVSEPWNDATRIREDIVAAISPRRYLDWKACISLVNEALADARKSGKLKAESEAHAPALLAIAEGVKDAS